MTPEQLKAILPTCRDARFWAHELEAVIPWGVTTPARLAAFVAQTAHESMNFTRLVENLSYSLRGLMATWPKRFPDEASAAPFARNPVKLGNYVYANRLGNGPPESGEGWKYRGRGLLQVTGKENYTKAGVALKLPLAERPDLLEAPGNAVKAAGWYWQTRELNELADDGSDEAFETLTRRINGGLTGISERMTVWRKAKEVLRA